MGTLRFYYNDVQYKIIANKSDAYYTPEELVANADIAFMFAGIFPDTPAHLVEDHIQRQLEFNALTRHPYDYCKKNNIPIVPLVSTLTIEDLKKDLKQWKANTINPLKHTRLLERLFYARYGNSWDSIQRPVSESTAEWFANHIFTPGSAEDLQNKAFAKTIVSSVAEISKPCPQATIIMPTRGLVLMQYIKNS